MTVASDLVRFLMQLFGDRQATQDFLEYPERVLQDHGLGAVSSADVDAAMPVVLDYAPVTVDASRFDGALGHNGGGTAYTPVPAAGENDGGHHGHEDSADAIRQLQHIVNNYSYASMPDDGGVFTDQSVSQNIWADGDIEQWFDTDSAIASGDRAVGAGDDADLDDSTNIEDSYNKDVDIDAGLDNVGNTDNREDNSTNTDVRDSGNSNSIDDSFNETETDIDAGLNNAGNTDNSKVTLENVGNETLSLDNVGNEYIELENFGNDSSDEPLTAGDTEDNNFAAAGDDPMIEDS
ncbi:hypothetical protein FBY31_1955 [Arthrobacter sp. SLBN-100]|uniref:IniB N-terminal domain-containing protein n=1 Tax=Arthrobacter sp. SLBN-100 TaxID=2768450 RepID=UPI00114E170F|nr:IniB N-terminal domain-containing protein [Arthrobacter sp. SLBN-100]TQJ67876.1 hypothetical protein FBY31_1955 [Arthrobacter sp. SLBN-100]